VKDVEESKSLLLGYTDVSARDALHAAFCKNLGIKEIFSFDKVFERFNWLRRIY
jgi:predicted nucleic acid-binding protein